MKATRVFFAGVLAALLTSGAVRAQEVVHAQEFELPPDLAQAPEVAPAPAEVAPPPAPVGSDIPSTNNQSIPGRLSNWMTYNRPNGCEGPLAHVIPMGSEFYVRCGPSIPFGDEVFGQTLDVGWGIHGGVRALFFDQHTADRAWTIDIGLSNTNNRAGINDVRVPLSIIEPNPLGIPTRIEFGKGAIPGVTVRGLNRTFLNIGLGREWYLWHSVTEPGNNLRVGIDGGGRYGTCKADFYEIRHRTDVIGGAYASAHTDFEIPCGCCIFQCGLRGEWSYTWSDILQRPSDLQELNVLVNMGVRY